MSSPTDPPPRQTFDAGSVALRSGETLVEARLVYAVHGTLNAAGDNAILMPTFYGATDADLVDLIGADRVLDPTRYCIVIPNMFGNGVSSSPSNHPGAFPLVTIHDNVTVQHRLVTEVLGIRRFVLVIGFSMGGQQAYEWAARFPAMVERLAVLCSAARTAPHTWVFLEGLATALQAGGSLAPGTPGAEVGKRALARVWAGWGLSQEWYRQGRWAQGGHASLEDYLRVEWEADMGEADARDLLSMIRTWQAHDIGGPDGGDTDFAAALGRISATSVIMPGSTDLYFPPEDAEVEVTHLRDGRLATIPSVLGHAAGAGADPADLTFIEAELDRLLAEKRS